MVVTKLKRQVPKKPTEENIESFIAAGGSSSSDAAEEMEKEIRITVRIPKGIVDALDRLRKLKPGHYSRNQAIVEILQSFLENALNREP